MKANKILRIVAIYDTYNKMMSVKECAVFLNVSEASIKRRIKNDIIKATYLDKRIIIPKLQFLKTLFPNEKRETQSAI